jgi:hypothetical protein
MHKESNRWEMQQECGKQDDEKLFRNTDHIFTHEILKRMFCNILSIIDHGQKKGLRISGDIQDRSGWIKIPVNSNLGTGFP